MAIASGAGIANVNYTQPLLAQIGRTLHVSVRQLGLLPMLTQIGFALGVFMLAPLGDILERKRLILTTLVLVTISLFSAMLSPNLTCLAISSLAIGITSVISTLVMPFAVALSAPEERGKTVGSIASALIIGALLSRTLSGIVGQAWGWRAMYGIASGLMVVLAIVMRSLLPHFQPQATMSYRSLIGSMFEIIRNEPMLREATINGMLCYAALQAFWATLIFYIEGPQYHYGAAVAGLFGLVGAAGAMSAPLIGRETDRHSPRTIAGIGVLCMLVSFIILWTLGRYLSGLIAGVVLLDLAAQCATISNQASIYTLSPETHSRLYTVYRAAYSVGGSVGAFLGVYAWSLYRWPGVCTVGMMLLCTALAIHCHVRKTETSLLIDGVATSFNTSPVSRDA